MLPNIAELRKNYERFDDAKLIRLATKEASGLRPEAVELIRQIIRERGLSEDIVKGLDVQREEIDEKTVVAYAELLRTLPCPLCSSTNEKLNATMTGRVTSYLIMTSYKKELVIACPDCLDKQNNDAMTKSALFGWWGLPWGIVYTIQSFLLNNKMKKQNRQSETSNFLKAFVFERVGRVEANRNNPAELQAIITNIR